MRNTVTEMKTKRESVADETEDPVSDLENNIPGDI